MWKSVVGVARGLGVAGALWAAGSAQSANAVTFDFENPPYTTGSIIGQDGWDTNAYVLADPFFGGAVNGTVEITSVNPISGLQSVLYNQTALLGGNTGASDVGKQGAVVAVESGTPAIDLTAAFQIKVNDNAIGAANNGSMGFFIGQGGRSPIIVLLTDAGPNSGNILIGDSGGLPDTGDFKGDDLLEFKLGVDLDGQNYEVSVRNITAGTPLTALTGSGPGGRFPFFGGTIADDGDGVSYTLGASLLLRSGVGRVDSVSVNAVPEPAAGVLAVAGFALAAIHRRKRG